MDSSGPRSIARITRRSTPCWHSWPRGQSETSRHSSAISLFDQLFIKPEVLPRDFSRWLHDAFLNRQAAGYGSELKLSREDIDALVAHARDFLAGVRQFLGSSGP